MHKLFIDSDIILDVFARREPFYLHSADLLKLVEKNISAGYTSPLVFANINYILQKMKSKEYALQSLRKLRIIINLVPLNNVQIDQALNSDFTDFEDAIQYYAAKSASMDYIITRNKKHFKASDLPVYSPKEYLAMLSI